MNTKLEKLTGARSTFQVFPIGVIEQHKKFSKIKIHKKFKLGIKGIEKYEKIIVLYWAPPLELCAARVVDVRDDEILVENLGIDNKPLIDIKPYMQRLKSCMGSCACCHFSILYNIVQ